MRIEKAMNEYKLPFPDVRFSKRLFEVVFQRPDLQKESYELRIQSVTEKVTENQKKILAQIKLNPFITTEELSKIVGISSRKIKENIAKLKNKDMLKRIGPAKGGHWEVVE